MSEKRKKTRRFWQFHLSTAVVMMLVAGAVMLPNVISRTELVVDEDAPFRYTRHVTGWPFIYRKSDGENLQRKDYYGTWIPVPMSVVWHGYFESFWLVVNAAVAILLLKGTHSLSESFIRRREARMT